MPRRRVSGSQMFGYTRAQEADLDVSFEPSRNQYVEAWLTYALVGGTDPKAFFEASAMPAVYPVALAKAGAMGFFVGGSIGFVFDPMHLHDSGFDEPEHSRWFDDAPMTPPGWG